MFNLLCSSYTGQYTVWPEILAGNLFWWVGSFQSNPSIFLQPKFVSALLRKHSFTIGLKILPTFRPDAPVFFRAKIFALKKTRASGRNVGKVFNPVVKLVLENQPFLMPEPAEKPSLQTKLVAGCAGPIG